MRLSAALPAPSGAIRAVLLAALASTNLVLSGGLTPVASNESDAVTVAFADRALGDALRGAVAAATPPAPAVTAVKSARAHAAPAKKKTKPAAAPKRWLPTGTGMWTYQWDQTEHGDARAIVARARFHGVTHLYVRTGTRKGGFDGGPVLEQLLPATKGTNVKVIAWDFPTLNNPVSDARRLAAAARFTVKGAPRVAAVAPDIETGSEGTKLSAAGVEKYLKTLRSLLPRNVAIIGVTPWPSEHRIGKYPFSHVAKYVDALAPMAYWINRDPATVTKQTMWRLAKFHKPVMPIGQAYDPRIDVPSLRWGPPSKAQVTAFFKTAKTYHAPAASLWVWQFASHDQWVALHAARPLFPARLQ